MTTIYLFDTSVLIQILRHDQGIEQRKSQVTETSYLNAIIYGELLFGAKHSTRAAQSIADVQSLVKTMKVLLVDEITADVYGDIAHDLRAVGHVIPDNDMWIVATARQYGLTLATRDAHFSRVSVLAVEQW